MEGGGGAEGVLNFVVGFLGTCGTGLIDTVLAARLGERCRRRGSRFGPEEDRNLPLTRLSSQRARRKEAYSRRSLHHRSHPGTPPCGECGEETALALAIGGVRVSA